MRAHDWYFSGFMTGIFVMTTVFYLIGSFLETAQGQYFRCVKDGGQRDYCVDRYLLWKEIKP